MSEVVDKMDIIALRLYAKELEWLKETQYDINFMSSRVEHLFADLTNALLDKIEKEKAYIRALNTVNGHFNDMARKYYPPHEMVANTDGTWDISEEQAKILSDIRGRGDLS